MRHKNRRRDPREEMLTSNYHIGEEGGGKRERKEFAE